MNRNVTIYRDLEASPDTSEYARARVTSKPTSPETVAPDLDDVVWFSFDRVTWLAADWDGAQWVEGTAKKRIAHLLMTDANLPPNGYPTLWVRLTDNPEAPIVSAGALYIQ